MPLTRHLCHMSETLTVSIGVEEHLCPEPADNDFCSDEAPDAVGETCCHFSVTHEKADLESLLKLQQPVWKLTAPALLPVAQNYGWVFSPGFVQQKETLPVASDSSPPLAGRSLLAFISILRI